MEAFNQLSNDTKSKHFSNLIYNDLYKIENLCNKYFSDVYFNDTNTADEKDKNAILERHLIIHIENIFSKAIWKIEIAEKEGLDIGEVKFFVEKMYNNYNQFGFKYLITNKYYNFNLDKVLTEQELNEYYKELEDSLKNQ